MGAIIPEKFQNWLLSQGVSTVLLFVLIFLFWHEVPGYIDKVTGSNEKTVQAMIDAFEADQERDEKRNERKDQLVRELLQNNGFAGEWLPASDIP